VERDGGQGHHRFGQGGLSLQGGPGGHGRRIASVGNAVKSWGCGSPRSRGRPHSLQLSQEQTVGEMQVRFGYSCSAAGECAAEAAF
jgi:hypothetical protein